MMITEKILQLALETLAKQKIAVETEIEGLRAELNGLATTAQFKTHLPAANRRKRSPKERLAQSRAMKLYWKRRKSEAAAKKSTSRNGKLSPAARRAISMKMRAIWKKRKAKAIE